MENQNPISSNALEIHLQLDTELAEHIRSKKQGVAAYLEQLVRLDRDGTVIVIGDALQRFANEQREGAKVYVEGLIREDMRRRGKVPVVIGEPVVPDPGWSEAIRTDRPGV